MAETGATRRLAGWAVLLLGWVVLAVPSGVVLHGVTTFVFADAGQRSRTMGLVVRAGPRIVGLGALLVGCTVLTTRRSPSRALWAILGGIAVAWPVFVVILWAVSNWLGLKPPRFGF